MARLKIKEGGVWQFAGYGPASDDWLSLGTCTYEGADAPTFTFSIASDVTALLNVGKRIKLTQTTVKYFLITDVGTYSGGKTIITVFGGTDYTLANAAITSPYYSSMKAPFGFPASREKWSVTATDTTLRAQASPSAATWYNLGSLSIVKPVGLFYGYYETLTSSTRATAGVCGSYVSLSTDSSSGVAEFTSFVQNNDDTQQSGLARREFNSNTTSKTTYYLNTQAFSATAANIYALNGNYGTTIIKLFCAYF